MHTRKYSFLDKRLSSTDDDFFNSHTLSYDTPLNNSNEDFLDIPIPPFSTPKDCQMEPRFSLDKIGSSVTQGYLTNQMFFNQEHTSNDNSSLFKPDDPPTRRHLTESQNNCFNKSLQADEEKEKAKEAALLQENRIIQCHEKSKLLLKEEPLETSSDILTVVVRHTTLGCLKTTFWRTDTFTQVYYWIQDLQLDPSYFVLTKGNLNDFIHPDESISVANRLVVMMREMENFPFSFSECDKSTQQKKKKKNKGWKTQVLK